MSRQHVAELVGFLAACIGNIAAILLAFPLFHLLRAREAIEDLERNLDEFDRADDRFAEMRASLHDLKLHVRQRRRTAVRFGVIGVIFLVVALVLLLGQGVLLYVSPRGSLEPLSVIFIGNWSVEII